MSCLSDILWDYEPQWQAPLTCLREAPSLGLMVMAAWTVVRRVAVRLVEEGVSVRAQQPTQWPACAQCGRQLRSKGFRPRTVHTLCGEVHWQRRVGRFRTAVRGHRSRHWIRF